VNPYWIKTIKTDGVRLAIIPRPRGQDWLPDDINLLQRAGIDVVVSALTATENEELGLVEESRCCQKWSNHVYYNMRFHELLANLNL